MLPIEGFPVIKDLSENLMLMDSARSSVLSSSLNFTSLATKPVKGFPENDAKSRSAPVEALTAF